MTHFSRRLLNMAESETLAMARLSRELKAQGKDIINLSLGEPDFDTPDYIKQAAKDAIDQNFSHYTPVAGYDELLDAICLKLKRDNGLDFKRSQILVSTGAKQCIANLVMACVDEGDEVIVPAPYWVSYREIIKMAGGKPVEVLAGIDQDFKVTAEQIEKAITPKTTMMMFSSPCNPTGSVYSYDELQSIVNVLAKHPEILVVSDEIYELINFVGKHVSIGTFDAVKDRTVTINGLSKAFAMTGWRLGYLAAPEAIAKASIKMQGQFTSATCSITQRAAIVALTNGPEEVADMVKAFKKRKELAHRLLLEIPNITVNNPQGAFYFFPDISYYIGKTAGKYTIKNSDDLSMYLIHEANVSTVPGSAFGAENYIRLSYATSEDLIEKAIARIKVALANLQ
jgi:aspartate aminotransferase